MSDKKLEFRHPSHGMIALSHYTTRSQRLFGSAIKTDSGISLSICRGMREHHLHQDWYHTDGKELIEVCMTESQFANMITNFNIGGGVPCTINSFGGKIIESPKDELSEAELIHNDIKDHVKGFKDKLAESSAGVNKVLDGVRISQKDRKAIDYAIECLMRNVSDNIPFLMEQFQESVDKAVVQAKTEVVSFAERTLKAKGLEAMGKNVPQISVDNKGE